LPENSFVTIRIFDMLGREVNTLVNKEMTAGTHSINWSGEDSFGMKVTSGTYVYRISSGKFNSVKKMVLIK
jgi:flagellar hook assembly protein FlgD